MTPFFTAFAYSCLPSRGSFVPINTAYSRIIAYIYSLISSIFKLRNIP